MFYDCSCCPKVSSKRAKNAPRNIGIKEKRQIRLFMLSYLFQLSLDLEVEIPKPFFEFKLDHCSVRTINKNTMANFLHRNGILLPKLFRSTLRKKCSSDRGKLLKFKAEGQ